MTDNLDALEDWVSPLLSQIEPAARSALTRKLAQHLRRSQQQRVLSQRNPDGTPFALRKKRDLRGKQGRIKNKVKMFHKLRTARHLKGKGDGNAVIVGFTGRVARIARVHQFGLRDRAASGSPKIKYPKRTILGFSSDEVEIIREKLLLQMSSPRSK